MSDPTTPLIPINSSSLDNQKPLISVIVGPTGSGKTKLAIDLAKHLDAEIIGLDSIQIYNRLCIGSAKPTPQQLQIVPHHLINTMSFYQLLDVRKYLLQAHNLINEILNRGKRVIICGGSFYYLEQLLFSTFCSNSTINQDANTLTQSTPFHPNVINNPDIYTQFNPSHSQFLEEFRTATTTHNFTVEQLYQLLHSIDSNYALHHRNNRRRLLRGVELYLEHLIPPTQLFAQQSTQQPTQQSTQQPTQQPTQQSTADHTINENDSIDRTNPNTNQQSIPLSFESKLRYKVGLISLTSSIETIAQRCTIRVCDMLLLQTPTLHLQIQQLLSNSLQSYHWLKPYQIQLSLKDQLTPITNTSTNISTLPTANHNTHTPQHLNPFIDLLYQQFKSTNLVAEVYSLFMDTVHLRGIITLNNNFANELLSKVQVPECILSSITTTNTSSNQSQHSNPTSTTTTTTTNNIEHKSFDQIISTIDTGRGIWQGIGFAEFYPWFQWLIKTNHIIPSVCSCYNNNHIQKHSHNQSMNDNGELKQQYEQNWMNHNETFLSAIDQSCPDLYGLTSLCSQSVLYSSNYSTPTNSTNSTNSTSTNTKLCPKFIKHMQLLYLFLTPSPSECLPQPTSNSTTSTHSTHQQSLVWEYLNIYNILPCNYVPLLPKLSKKALKKANTNTTTNNTTTITINTKPQSLQDPFIHHQLPSTIESNPTQTSEHIEINLLSFNIDNFFIGSSLSQYSPSITTNKFTNNKTSLNNNPHPTKSQATLQTTQLPLLTFNHTCHCIECSFIRSFNQLLQLSPFPTFDINQSIQLYNITLLSLSLLQLVANTVTLAKQQQKWIDRKVIDIIQQQPLQYNHNITQDIQHNQFLSQPMTIFHQDTSHVYISHSHPLPIPLDQQTNQSVLTSATTLSTTMLQQQHQSLHDHQQQHQSSCSDPNCTIVSINDNQQSNAIIDLLHQSHQLSTTTSIPTSSISTSLPINLTPNLSHIISSSKKDLSIESKSPITQLNKLLHNNSDQQLSQSNINSSLCNICYKPKSIQPSSQDDVSNQSTNYNINNEMKSSWTHSVFKPISLCIDALYHQQNIASTDIQSECTVIPSTSISPPTTPTIISTCLCNWIRVEIASDTTGNSLPSLSTTNESLTTQLSINSKEPIKCEYCDIVVLGNEQFKVHKKGKKHKYNVKQSKLNTTDNVG